MPADAKGDAMTEDLQSRPGRRPAEPQVRQKHPYEPPKATFVPLKLEEKLLSCGKRAMVKTAVDLCSCSADRTAMS